MEQESCQESGRRPPKPCSRVRYTDAQIAEAVTLGAAQVAEWGRAGALDSHGVAGLTSL
jgi:hypothetical protein